MLLEYKISHALWPTVHNGPGRHPCFMVHNLDSHDMFNEQCNTNDSNGQVVEKKELEMNCW